MHYDSYLFKIKFDLDFHLIDFVFSFMLRVFKLGTKGSQGSQVRICRFRVRKSISGSGLGYFWAISGSGIVQCWPFSGSGIGLSGPGGRGFVPNEIDGRPFWTKPSTWDKPGSWSIQNGMIHLPRWSQARGSVLVRPLSLTDL